jgi:two-component system, OmpR family, sensor histidine kinase MprB
MTFRARLALVAAAAVALAVVVASFVVYFVVRSELRGPIDNSLKKSAAEIQQSPSDEEIDRALFHLTAKLGGAAGYPQVVKPDGTSIPAIPAFGPKIPLPVDDQDREVARGERGTFLRDATVAGTHVRMITFPVPSSVGLVAVQVVRPLTEVDDTLGRVENFLILIGGLGIAIAAGVGLLVARAALAPVRRLTTATETVTKTGDLSQRIDDRGSDELSRLAASFNAMLAALQESSRAQRQLVADASHELRTPLTSLRTNIEVLASERELPAGERERLLDDVVEQLGEMTTLIAELMDLARGEEQAGEPEEVRLDLLTADAVERARRNRPGVTFVTELQESIVHGVPATLERAVANLLDNAAKWSPPNGQVEVAVRDGHVTVRDHGPGIDEEDLPYVFDRFYRASSARGLPGSGLGLAIVRQVAVAHGGTVVAERAEGGGTRMTLSLNGREASTKVIPPADESA